MLSEVRIESLAYTGAGIAHQDDGRVVFVSGGLPGDRALVEIQVDKTRYLRARLVELLEASELRLDAACQHAGQCGGCPWQCLAYPAQLEWKRRFVADALERVGHIPDAEALVAPIEASPKTWYYRNKVEFSVFGQAGRLHLGMHQSNDTEPTAISSCLLLPKVLADEPLSLGGTLNFALGREPVQPYRLGIRHSARTKSCELALWSTPCGMQRGFVAGLLAKAVPNSSTVRVLTRSNDAGRKVVNTEVLSGQGSWTEQLAGFRFMISAPSFFQVNTAVAEAMVAKLVELAAPADKHIWDLYCGAGTFSLPLAAAGATVSAVELAGSSLRDLRRNLKNANLEKGVQVVSGDVAIALRSLAPARLAVVDPPRSGLKPQVTAQLVDSPTAELIYVSCDPQTLARDAALLVAGGYHLQGVYPYDLMPQSYHVETIAYFVRGKTA